MSKSKKGKKKPVNNNIIKNAFLRIIVVLLLVGLNWVAVSTVMPTISFYHDQELSDFNFTASVVDLSLAGEDFSPLVTPDQSANKNIHISNNSSFDFQYDSLVDNFTGDLDLCEQLSLVAKLGGLDVYSGDLLDFAMTTTTLTGSVSLPLDLEIFLPVNDESLKNKTCNFNLNVWGWQNNWTGDSQGFSDLEVIVNSVSSGEWTNEDPVESGDVVINEIMWSGSLGDTDDEWIELRNMTDHDIDLSNWNINNAGSGGGPGAHLEIPHGYSIKANGYFLITNNKWDGTAINLTEDLASDEGLTHKAGMNLLNGGEGLILKDQEGNTIDMAWQDDASWPAGSNGTIKKSMERNDLPGDGTLASNWHTCEDESSTSLYWDEGRTEMGTPGADNLSDNDFSILPLLLLSYDLESESTGDNNTNENQEEASSNDEQLTPESDKDLSGENIGGEEEILPDDSIISDDAPLDLPSNETPDDSSDSELNSDEPATEPTLESELPEVETPIE